MTPLLWFAVALVVALVYSVRAQRYIIPQFQLDWRAALVCVGSLIVGAFFVVRAGAELDTHMARFVHPLIIAALAWLGLHFWSARRVWRFGAPFIAVSLAHAYASDRGIWNNTIVIIAVLAVVPASMYLARSWAYVVYLVLAVLDGYAIWGSGVMNSIVSHAQPTFPSAIVLNQSVTPLLRPLMAHMSPTAIHVQQTTAWVLVSLREVGLMDVVLACLAVAMIARFNGSRAGLLMAVMLQSLIIAVGASFVSGLCQVTELPFLVLASPVIVAFLALTSRRPTCS